MKKIIIFGFPHCGTTILRSIISHIKGVYEIVDEFESVEKSNVDIKDLEKNEEIKYVLCKYPYLIKENELKENYKDYIKIFIVRNPLFVFTSLNKRFQNLDKDHSIQKYKATIEAFNKYKNNKNLVENMHLIRYEDLFEKEYENMKELLKKSNIEYDDEIFKNENYKNRVQHLKESIIPIDQPKNEDHDKYRLYQINQPFKNNNKKDEIKLYKEQYEEIIKDENIKKIFPKVEEFNVIFL
jgi:hypothetical protein